MKSKRSPRSSPDLYGHALSRRFSIIRLCLSGGIVLSCAAVAATATWDGGADPDLNLSNAANWTGDVLPLSSDDLHFAGSANVYPFNDLATDVGGTFTVNSITFDSGADPFELSGTAINFNGKTITNNSSNLQNVVLQLKDTGSGFTVAGDGDLYLANIFRPTGFGSNFVKNGSGTVSVANRNTSYRIVLNNGTIDWAETSGNGIAANVTVNGGTLKATGGVNPFHFGVAVSMPNTAGTTPATISLPANVTTKFSSLSGVVGSVIHNVGATGQTSTLQLRNNSNSFAGSIQDGPDGGKTAVIIGETANQTFTFSGANTFTGNLTVQSTQTFTLAASGSLLFKPQPAAVCNKITGPGTAALNGSFKIDLSAVESPVSGDAWTLVDGGTLNETYGATFAVAAPFSETSSGFWTYNSGAGVFTFSESTGQLTYGRVAVTTWDGGANPDANWSNNTNWDQTPVSNDLLVFAGAPPTIHSNDLDTDYDTGTLTPASFLVGGIRFDAGAGAYTLQGNAIDFGGKNVINNSTATQTLEMPLQFDNAVGGLTVDAAAGDVVINNVTLRNGFNAPLTKNGTHKLVVNGTADAAFSLIQNSGTVEVNTNQILFFHSNIAAGATLVTGGTSPTGILHSGGTSTINGTLDLAQDVNEDVSSFLGSGTITNHGSAGTTSTLVTRNSVSRTFSGTIKDGTAGGRTALQIGAAGGIETGVLTLTGTHSYTGDTTFGQPESSLALSSTGSLRFKPGASGVSNQIATGSPQVTGTVQLDGKFFVDLGSAEIANGNSWTLVDSANLNETYGSTFQIVNPAHVPATSYVLNSGAGAFGSYGEDDSFTTAGGNYANANAIDTSAVVDPAPVEVYQSERNGNFTYTLPGLGAGASYKVRLHFAEIYHNGPGLRAFDVLINGSLVLDNFDVFAAAGAKNKANVQEFTVPASSGGSISIQFVTAIDNAKVSGIEVIPLGGGIGPTFSEAADVWTMVDGNNTWSFTEATGVLSLAVGGSGGNYASWANSNGIPGESATGDFDHDGMSNLMEYALGKSPTVSSVPAGTHVSGVVSFSKGAEAVANGDVTWVIQESDDLGAADAWQTVTPSVNSNSTISYTLPAGKPKVFVRLLVGQQ